MGAAAFIKKTTNIFLILAFFFTSCELTKRRYTGGWYVSRSSTAKSVTDAKTNERFLAKAFKQEAVEIANIVNEEKASERIENSFLFKDVKTKKHASFINKFDTKQDTVRNQNETKKGFNNKAFLIGEYTTFGLSLVSAALGFVTLNTFSGLAIVFFALAGILLLISVVLSHIAIRKIRKRKLDHKITPHAIITGIILGIYCLIVAAIATFIAALATANPAVPIVAGLITFLVLFILALNKI